MNKVITRRSVVKSAVFAAGASVAIPSLAIAANKESNSKGSSKTISADLTDIQDLQRYDFILPRVKYACKSGVIDYWNAKPGGDANLLREFSKVVRCKVKPILRTNDTRPPSAFRGQLNAVVTFDQLHRLKRFPFLFMTGESYFKLTKKQLENLREYLYSGGFIFMDDCMAHEGQDFFFQSSLATMHEIFGEKSVKKIPLSHEIFHNVFDLSDIGLPFCWGKRRSAYGVSIGDRLVAMLSSNDLHCGWCDSKGVFLPRKGGDPPYKGPHSYRVAIKMGINMLMYAVTH